VREDKHISISSTFLKWISTLTSMKNYAPSESNLFSNWFAFSLPLCFCSLFLGNHSALRMPRLLAFIGVLIAV